MKKELYRLGRKWRAHLTILEVVRIGATRETTVYRVKMHCCKVVSLMNHRNVRRRGMFGTRFCVACRNRANLKARTLPENSPIESGFHGWIPPESALNLPEGWFPK